MIARYSETITGLLLVALAAFAMFEASKMSGGARFFPMLVSGALGIFSLIYLVRSVLAARPSPPTIPNAGKFFIVLIGSIIYINAIVAVGYITSTVVFIPLIAWLIGFRRPVFIIVTTLVYIVSVYVLFEVLFGRALPS